MAIWKGIAIAGMWIGVGLSAFSEIKPVAVALGFIFAVLGTFIVGVMAEG